MKIQYKFNIEEMLEGLAVLLERVHANKINVSIGPFDEPTMEETGLVIEQNDGDAIRLLDEFFVEYLTGKKINYVRNEYA